MAPICFRVRNIPSHYGRDDLSKLLASLWGLNSANGLSIPSLAVDAVRPQNKVATIQFRQVPGQLDDSKLSWTFTFDDGTSSSRNLLVDTTFLGLTTLSSPPREIHKVDIIALSGLGGHAFGSFRHKETGHMWLRDSLVQDLEGARVMIYGHDSRVPSSISSQDLAALGGTFREQLGTICEGLQTSASSVSSQWRQSTVPKILVGHSLGGLIIKQSMIQMVEGGVDVLSTIRAVIFFGVPSLGLQTESLIPMATGQPNQLLIHTLSCGSQLLESLCKKFKQKFSRQNLTVVSYYETEESPTAKRDVNGRWKMTGSPKLLVDKTSTIFGLDWVNDSNFGAINRTHSELVKFNEQDDIYDRVLHRFRRLLDTLDVTSRFPRRALTDDEKDCLRSLSFPEMDFKRKEVSKAAAHTCEWIFDHPVFQNWRDGKERMLWISGKPGSGKSTLFKHLVKRFDHQPHQIILTFFFHARGSNLEKTPLGLYRSLVYQLFSMMPDAFQSMVKSFCHNRETKKEWNWHVDELQEYFQAALSDTLSERISIQIMVDALDECVSHLQDDGDRPDQDGDSQAVQVVNFLAGVTSALRSDKLNVLFTCRHYPVLEPIGCARICIDNENGDDIRVFVANECEQRFGRDVPEIRDKICQLAQGVFQWALLVLSKTSKLDRWGRNSSAVLKAIDDIPQSLADLYRSLLKTLEDEFREESIRLLRWVCFATRPLTLSELRFGLYFLANDAPPHSLQACQEREDFIESDDKMQTIITQLSCGLAETRRTAKAVEVQFIHQSVQDFFVENWGDLFGGSSPARHTAEHAARESHYMLSLSCLHYLSMDDFRGREFSRHEITRTYFAQYAITNLAAHLRLAEGSHPEAFERHLFDIKSLFDKALDSWLALHERIEYFSLAAQDSTLHHIVARNGLLSFLTISDLLADDGLHSTNNDGRIPLSLAAEHGHEAVVKLLLDRRKDYGDFKDSNGQTPLSWAARRGREAVVKLLLATGSVDVDAKDTNGRTPLSWAAGYGHEAVVKLLLATGSIDVDAKDTLYGQTPLSWAAEDGREAVVKLLLATGSVDVDAKDTNGRTPLSWAAGYGHEAVVKLLLATGSVDVDAKSTNGRTPLSWAAEDGHEAVVKLLLATGSVDVDAKDTNGRTPLSWAAEDGHEAVVKLLLATGSVDVDAKDTNGRTPLSWAAGYGYEAVVKLLLAEKADVHGKDAQFGWTPLIWAAKRGHETVVELLKTRAVDVEPS